MKNDEKQPPFPQRGIGWTYDQEQPGSPEELPPRPIPRLPDVPFEQMNDSGLLSPEESYYPDLTMDMGNSLGYGQDIQHHAISMPQPTQSLPRLRQQRLQELQQLRQERISRKARRLGPESTALTRPESRNPFVSGFRRKPDPFIAPPPAPHIANSAQPGGESIQAPGMAVMPNKTLQPASEPLQSTAEIQRVKVARASSLISGAFLLSSILGLLQTFLFTYIFGGKSTGESYLQAYIIPNLIFTVISGGALSSAFIPVFTSYAVKEKDEKTAWHIASSALNLSVICLIIVAIIAIFLTPVFVPIYNHQPKELALTITLTRIMLIQAVVLGSGVIISSILNAKQDFAYTALGAVLYNVGLDVGLIPGFFLTFHAQAGAPSDATAVYAATWGVVIGAILQVGVQIPGLFKVKMRYSFAFDWRHSGVRTIVRQMIPRVFNALMLSLSTLVDRTLLSSLAEGLINPYVQAFSILILPVSLFASAVSTAAFPTLASYASQGRLERVRSIITETLRNILFLTIPSGIGLMVLSFPIAQALLEHGSFALKETSLSSITLRFFAIGLPSLAAVEILTRSFYALQDSKTPVTVSVFQFILKIALSLVLVNLAVFGAQWGMGALAFSTSVASTIEAIALFILLSRRIDGFDLSTLKRFFGRTLLASGAMALVLFITSQLLNSMIDTTSMKNLFIPGILMAITKLLLELLFGIATFLVAARLLNMEEMNSGLVRRVLNLLHIPWL